MEVDLLNLLAKYRLVIGYLGERSQFGWWQSSFFTQGSSAFLSPLFGRTQILAQCNGVTRAAALVHDDRIGVGNVYHLFRLPEDIEQGIHQVLHSLEPGKEISSQEIASAYLSEHALSPITSAVGPTLVGKKNDLQDPQHWQIAASHYLTAFQSGQQTFPYYTDTL